MQRYDGKGSQNRLSAEFTTGQLIAIICISLFVAVACFGLGILVGRVDPPPENETVASAETGEAELPTPEMETYTTPAFGTEPAEATPVTAQTTTAQRTPETPPPRNPYMDNTPRLTALPPLTPYRSLPVQAEAPTRIPRVDTPAATATPAPAPVATTPALTPIDPIEPPVDNTPAASAPPVATKPVATPDPAAAPSPAPSGKGKFGVQLAAFSGGDRRTRAESFQRHVRTELKVEAAIIPSSDDVHYRVIVGGFPTKESAAAACTELKNKAGLSEAFVRPL